MAVVYQLAPVPKWYFADETGRPLSAGTMEVYSSLDHSVSKIVYKDGAGIIPWPTTIDFDLNGTQGPFYWKFDPDNADDMYYLRIYDMNGNFIFDTTYPYGPTGDTGGGSIPTRNGLQNLIVNGVMNHNCGTVSPISQTEFIVAPGAHSGLALTDSIFGPDIWFKKSNATAADELSFPSFILGNNDLTDDVTPAQFCRYVCTAPGTETFKYIQFPITQNVQNLSGNVVTISIWARCNSGADSLQLKIAQFFGDGINFPSATAETVVKNITLTTAWVKYTATFTVPSVSGKTIGNCNNDGIFLEVCYPTAAATSIDFTKLDFYLGNVIPTEQYTPYDFTDSVIFSDRTAKIIQQFSSYKPYGYIFLNDGTIGNSGTAASTLADPSAFPLFNSLWNDTTNSECPVSGGRGASAVADWGAGKTLKLPLTSNRVLANAYGTSNVLGLAVGDETHTLQPNELPSHTHTFDSSAGNFLVTEAGTGLMTGGGFDVTDSSVSGTTGGGPGTDTPFSIVQPTSYDFYLIKL